MEYLKAVVAKPKTAAKEEVKEKKPAKKQPKKEKKKKENQLMVAMSVRPILYDRPYSVSKRSCERLRCKSI